MTISVSSYFYEQLTAKASRPKRVFTLGGSDYSDYVTRWPTISRQWDDVRPQTVTMTLADEDRAFSFLRLDKTHFNSTCAVKFGYTHPTSGDELVTVFSGKLDRVQYQGGTCRVTIADKFKQLSERVMGTRDAPVTFTGSTLPSDIAWAACTSYGGLSAVESTSNPDIDYQSWLDWAAVFSGDAVYMNGEIEDLKVVEVLRRLSRHTLSAIYVDQNRVTFQRFSLIDSAFTTLDDEITDLEIRIDDNEVVNRQHVYAAYVPASDDWGIRVFDEVPASVNSFGLREEVEKDDAIWYVTSGAATNLAQRYTSIRSEPYDKLTVTSPLVLLLQQLGDNVAVVDSFYNIDGSYRLMGYKLDLEKAQHKAAVDVSQYSNPFTLDVSTLDGSDVLI